MLADDLVNKWMDKFLDDDDDDDDDDFHGFHRISMDFIEFPRISQDLQGCN